MIVHDVEHINICAADLVRYRAIDHVAFAVKGYDAICTRLNGEGIAFESYQVPDNPTRQMILMAST